MKRIIALLLAVLLLCSFAACAITEETGAESEQTLRIETLADTTAQPADTAAETTPAEPITAETTPAEPADEETAAATEAPQETTAPLLDENGSYTTKDDVALYIHQYGHLPQNYITKKAAEKLGWTGGSLEPYAPGKCIGGSYFGNYEGKLPTAPGRSYTECDIDTLGARSRGAKRLVFSNDGLIYYTEDHYETFELLYGEVDG